MKNDMREHQLIKLIKRAERLEQQPATGANHGSSARDQAREQAATVKGWIDESRQTRPARYEEIRRQFGWPEGEGDMARCGMAGESGQGGK
ncbi:MAG: hypothetical protein ACJ741_14485 [Pyrinomonadaceae bacterium]